MKSIKLLSLLLALVMACCVMVGCGGSGDSQDTTTVSTAPAYSVTVSISVIDMDGSTVIEAKNYSYTSGVNAPTAYTVLDDYCYMNYENGEGMITRDGDGRLVSIGKVAAVDGTSYWSITVNGKEISLIEFSTQELASGDTVVITLKDTSLIGG